MKKIFIVLIVFSLLDCKAQGIRLPWLIDHDTKHEAIPYQAKNGKWGYMSVKDSSIALKAKYERVTFFFKKKGSCFAYVKKKNGKVGVIGRNFEYLVRPDKHVNFFHARTSGGIYNFDRGFVIINNKVHKLEERYVETDSIIYFSDQNGNVLIVNTLRKDTLISKRTEEIIRNSFGILTAPLLIYPGNVYITDVGGSEKIIYDNNFIPLDTIKGDVIPFDRTLSHTSCEFLINGGADILAFSSDKNCWLYDLKNKKRMHQTPLDIIDFLDVDFQMGKYVLTADKVIENEGLQYSIIDVENPYLPLITDTLNLNSETEEVRSASLQIRKSPLSFSVTFEVRKNGERYSEARGFSRYKNGEKLTTNDLIGKHVISLGSSFQYALSDSSRDIFFVSPIPQEYIFCSYAIPLSAEVCLLTDNASSRLFLYNNSYGILTQLPKDCDYVTNKSPLEIYSSTSGWELLITKKGKHGFVDEKGNIKHYGKYDDSFGFVGDLVVVSKNDKVGVLDKDLNIKIPFRAYKTVSPNTYFYQGYAKVIKNGRVIFIDTEGREYFIKD